MFPADRRRLVEEANLLAAASLAGQETLVARLGYTPEVQKEVARAREFAEWRAGLKGGSNDVSD